MFVSGNDRSVCYIHFHGARLFFFNSLLVIVPHPRIMIQQKHLTWQETMNVASLARSIYIYIGVSAAPINRYLNRLLSGVASTLWKNMFVKSEIIPQI